MDVTIGTCEIEILRPRGSVAPWEDREDHQALASRVQAVVAGMLDEVLAARLQFLGAEDLQELSEVVIDLDLSARDLVGAAPMARPDLRDRLVAAVRDALTATVPPNPNARVGPTSASAGSRLANGARSALSASRPTDRHAAARRLIERLFSEGRGALVAPSVSEGAAIFRLLILAFGEALPPGQRRKLVSALDDPVRFQGVSVVELRPEAVLVLSEFAEALRVLGKSPDVARPVAQERLRAVETRGAELVQRLAGLLDEPLLEGRKPGGVRADGAPTGGNRMPPRASPSLPDGPAAPMVTQANDDPPGLGGLGTGTHDLDHALPFLAFAALADRGILDAIAVDFDTPSNAALFAAAIARKCLGGGPEIDPSGRDRAVAAAAGLADAPKGEDFQSLAAKIAPEAATARAVVQSTLAGQLQDTATLPLVVTGKRIALIDPGGFFPVAVGDLPEMLPMLRKLGRSYFLEAADTKIWTVLADAGLPLFATGAPLPGEPGNPVIGRGGWMGRASGNSAVSSGLALALSGEAERATRAALLWRGLLDGPPLTAFETPPDGVLLLEELSALLAGFALADIGWRLSQLNAEAWADPDMDLVRERFLDFGAKLRVAAGSFELRLPLGRRHADLSAIGLLGTIPSLPWRPDVSVSFSGG